VWRFAVAVVQKLDSVEVFLVFYLFSFGHCSTDCSNFALCVKF